jgi:hypothetical protein
MQILTIAQMQIQMNKIMRIKRIMVTIPKTEVFDSKELDVSVTKKVLFVW